MPQDVINRVHTLARRSAANVALTYADRFGETIPDDDDDDDGDDDYIPNDDDDDDDDYPFDANDDDNAPDDAGYIAGVEGHYPPNSNQQNKTTKFRTHLNQTMKLLLPKRLLSKKRNLTTTMETTT